MKDLNVKLGIDEIKYLIQRKLDRDYKDYNVKVYIQPDDFKTDNEYTELMKKGEAVAIIFNKENLGKTNFVNMHMMIPSISENSKNLILCLKSRLDLKNNTKERNDFVQNSQFFDVMINNTNMFIVSEKENDISKRTIRGDLILDEMIVGHMLKYHNQNGEYEEYLNNRLKEVCKKSSEKSEINSIDNFAK